MPDTRLAQLNDLDRIGYLFDQYRQFYDQAPDQEKARDYIHTRFTNNESIILVALNDEELITGFCQLYPTFCSVEAGPILVLYDLFVDPDHRRNGIGKALLIGAHELAKARGVLRMDLSTGIDNTSAQALYESLGWERDEEFYVYSLAV